MFSLEEVSKAERFLAIPARSDLALAPWSCCLLERPASHSKYSDAKEMVVTRQAMDVNMATSCPGWCSTPELTSHLHGGPLLGCIEDPQAMHNKKSLERGGGGEQRRGRILPSTPAPRTEENRLAPCPSFGCLNPQVRHKGQDESCSEFCTVQSPAPGMKVSLGIGCPKALHGILSIT